MSDLKSFRRARCTFRTVAISLSFSSPFLGLPVPFQDLLDTLRVERSVSFQALLDSFQVERPASVQALLCSSARAESNTSSLVLRYFARRLAFFFSRHFEKRKKTTLLSYKEVKPEIIYKVEPEIIYILSLVKPTTIKY